MSVQPFNLSFNVPRIFQDIIDRIYHDHTFDRDRFNSVDQIILRGENWFEGIGSTYRLKEGKHTVSQNDFTTTTKRLSGTYLDLVIKDVEKFAAETDGVKIGRIRIMRLKSKACYTLHKDQEEFRYHIPLSTDDRCFFVVGDEIARMPEVGKLYRLRTNHHHTAVNASWQSRTHILFDTYV